MKFSREHFVIKFDKKFFIYLGSFLAVLIIALVLLWSLNKEKVVKSIPTFPYYEFNLPSNPTPYQEELYEKVKIEYDLYYNKTINMLVENDIPLERKLIGNDEDGNPIYEYHSFDRAAINGESLAEIQAMVFVTDLLTLSNKSNRNSIGGAEYIFDEEDYVKQFTYRMSKEYYKYLDEYIERYGSENLPTVSNIKVYSIKEIEFKPYGDPFPTYEVCMNIEYNESNSFPKENIVENACVKLTKYKKNEFRVIVFQSITQ